MKNNNNPNNNHNNNPHNNHNNNPHNNHNNNPHNNHNNNHNFESSLKIAIGLTFLFFLVEVVGGFISGSLSLLGDAGHMFRDVFALMLSFYAIKVAKSLPTETKTFGMHRAEIFAALVNGLFLVGVSGWIFWEAYLRFFNPEPIRSGIMFWVALVGLLVNLYVVFKLHGSHDLNIKSAFIHVLMDTFSSVAVILASVWIYFTGQFIVDPLLGLLIGGMVLFSAFGVIKDTIRILFQFTPKGIELNKVVREIKKVEGVEGVHNVHLWSLCSHINVIDAHVYVCESDLTKIEKIKKKVKKNLEKYKIKHATLEFEGKECWVKGRVKGIEH